MRACCSFTNNSGIPKTGITIALMINLQNTIGAHEIFQTVGDHSDHNEGNISYKDNIEEFNEFLRFINS